jgi:uncharacterized membrane protein YdbT with pleckstrin-like domain
MPPTNITVTNRANPVPLLSTESVVFKSRKSTWLLATPLFIVVVIGVVLILVVNFQIKSSLGNLSNYLVLAIAVVTGFISLIIVLDWLTTVYTLTNRRVQWRFGIVGEQTKTITLNQITNTKVMIGIFGRALNYGDVVIEAANINSNITFKAIPNPNTKKEQIDNAQNS